MSTPLAYFLTWTTYGTWLHGDARGSVDALHNGVGTPLLTNSVQRQQIDARRLKCSVFELDTPAREVVDSVIRRHCEIRGWRLHALNVRTNHVHAVLTCEPSVPPERAMEQFKAWSTRRLRERGCVRAGHPVWTEHGSTRWINENDGLYRAIDYVLNRQ